MDFGQNEAKLHLFTNRTDEKLTLLIIASLAAHLVCTGKNFGFNKDNKGKPLPAQVLLRIPRWITCDT